MRGVVILLGLLILLAGGAVAAAQYAPVDLSMLDSVAGAKEFLTSQMALYAGGGGAAFGLLLIIIGFATGGKKKPKEKAAKAAPAKAAKPAPVKAEKAASVKAEPVRAEPKKAEPAPSKVAPPQPASTKPAPAAAPAAPMAKPQASAQPPAGVQPVVPHGDPRLMNRKRVQDLVTINDALKAYRAKHGAYPKANGLTGIAERGTTWIPGLSPDFLAELPRDPALSGDRTGPQYVYASNGADYKLLAQGVSLIGSANVEVLGVRIDPTRNPTAENASFGFWTEGFATA